jgi:hypothetical protein
MAHAILGFPSENVAATATLTASAADAGYPAVRLGDFGNRYLGARARLTTTSGYWTLSFAGAQPLALVALWHNFDEGLSVRFQGSSDNFGSTPLNEPFLIPARRPNGYTVKAWLDLTQAPGYLPGGYPSYRVNVLGTNSVACQAKLWAASVKRPLPTNLAWGARETHTQTTIDQPTTYGYRWTYDLQAAPRSLQGVVRASDATRDLVTAWVADCGGHARPALFVPDPAVNDAWIVRAQLAGSASGLTRAQLDVTREFVNYNPLTLQVEEVVGGLPE